MMTSTLHLNLIRIGGCLLLTALPPSLPAAGGTLTTGGGCGQRSAADTRMFVRNLDPSVTEEQLSDAFSQFGVVSSVTLAKDPVSGNSRGLAYVEMPNAQEGCDARRNLHNTEINGKAIEVMRNPGGGPGINTTGGFQSRAQPGATLPMATNTPPQPPPENSPTPVDSHTENPSVPGDPTPSSISAADASDDGANVGTAEDHLGADATDSDSDAADDEMIEEEELDEEIADDDAPIADESEAPEEGEDPDEGEALDDDAESAVDDESDLAEDDAPADEEAFDGGDEDQERAPEASPGSMTTPSAASHS